MVTDKDREYLKRSVDLAAEALEKGNSLSVPFSCQKTVRFYSKITTEMLKVTTCVIRSLKLLNGR